MLSFQQRRSPRLGRIFPPCKLTCALSCEVAGGGCFVLGGSRMEGRVPCHGEGCPRLRYAKRYNILLGLSLDYLLMEGHLCFSHPHVNKFPGVFCHLNSSPLFPIWPGTAMYCTTLVGSSE